MGPARRRTRVSVLALAALVVVAVAAVVALLSEDGGAPYPFISLRGETVQVYGGVGPYAYDTVTKALMQRAFDVYYVVAGIPVALVGLVLYVRGRAAGLPLLMSSLLFLAYASLISSIGIAYNDFFLAYLAILVLSGSALVHLVHDLPQEPLAAGLPPRRHVRAVGVVTLALATYFVVTWLAMDIGVLASGTVHPALEIYTTAEQNVTDVALFGTASVWAGVAALRGRRHAALFCTALVLMAGQMLVALTLYSVGRADYLGLGAGGVEWPLPIAATVCLGVGLMVLRRLRAPGSAARASARSEALEHLAAGRPTASA